LRAGNPARRAEIGQVYPRAARTAENGSSEQLERSMQPFCLIMISALVITVLSGAAATVLAASKRPSELRSRIAEKLVEIALVGAGAIMALLYALARS
jgi:hypothetical protein